MLTLYLIVRLEPSSRNRRSLHKKQLFFFFSLSRCTSSPFQSLFTLSSDQFEIFSSFVHLFSLQLELRKKEGRKEEKKKKQEKTSLHHENELFRRQSVQPALQDRPTRRTAAGPRSPRKSA
jgi:hypothetical protein